MSLVSIIIPSFNNPQYLYPCINSIMNYTMPDDLFKIYVVNNGEPAHMEPLKGNPYVEVLQMKENVGWEGGLQAGLAASKEPYVLLLNDDTHIPPSNRGWLATLLNHFAHPNCAAVGPSSNCVMGKQNMFIPMFQDVIRAKFLIGFCMLVRRADLEAAGGIDAGLPGGDDLDLSIRLRNLGKYLLIDRNVLVYHHGFKTGERVEGPANVQGGWNSIQKIERTNHALINKHGLRAFLDLWSDYPAPNRTTVDLSNPECEIVKRFAEGHIAEIGCGDKKLFPDSIGIDITPKGEQVPGIAKGRISLADITANVEQDLPVPHETFDTIIAQHILEHMVDAIGATEAWKKALKHGGKLIVAVPDHSTRNTIPMNWQHVHAWTPASLKRFMEAQGWHTVDLLDSKNDVSFVGVFSKNGVTNGL